MVIPACHRRRRLALALAVAAATSLTPAAEASDEDRIDAAWRGTTVVVRAPIGSDCGGFYTDNEVVGGRPLPEGRHRFASGELGVVYKIDLHRSSVDVHVDLVEPVLSPYTDGPFTLYDELRCKVELEIQLAGDRGADGADRAIAAVLERHATAETAHRSPLWNRRQRDPYPPDYQQTLAEHAVWKAQQVNAAVQGRLDEAIDVAARSIDRLPRGPEETAGFAEGLHRGRSCSIPSCESAVGRSLESYLSAPPRDESRRFKDGFEEGQRLAVAVQLIDRLRGCFVPVPPLPRGD